MSDQWDITGKTCLVTGANSGIGYETVLQLLRLGAGRVIMACRNMDTAKEAVEKIKKEFQFANDDEFNRRISLRHLDLGSLKSVKRFADEVLANEKSLHVLINNAGVLPPWSKTLTEDGFELSFGTNHIGHFYLTNLLLDLMKQSAPSRIVIVSSIAYKFCWPFGGFHIDDVNYDNSFYHTWAAYGQSKLANILHCLELDRRLKESGNDNVTVYSLHPGNIATNLQRNQNKLWQWFIEKLGSWTPLLISPQDGANTSVHCATSPGLEKYSGKYFE